MLIVGKILFRQLEIEICTSRLFTTWFRKYNFTNNSKNRKSKRQNCKENKVVKNTFSVMPNDTSKLFFTQK